MFPGKQLSYKCIFIVRTNSQAFNQVKLPSHHLGYAKKIHTNDTAVTRDLCFVALRKTAEAVTKNGAYSKRIFTQSVTQQCFLDCLYQERLKHYNKICFTFGTASMLKLEKKSMRTEC